MPSLLHADRGQRLGLVDYWVFDLDNTLYPVSSSLFPQIDVRMRRFIAEALHLSLDEAYILQKRYYHQYGTTLRGLMLAHGIEPDKFLAFVHDIDCTVLAPAPKLENALGRLAGKKYVFTNGSERHAENVLGRLGVAHHFDGIFDIRAADYIPKPNAESYDRMAKRLGLTTERAAMFEDIERNLEPAAQAGMITIWVCEEGHARWEKPDPDPLPGYVDYLTRDLAAWLDAVATAQADGTPPSSLP